MSVARAYSPGMLIALAALSACSTPDQVASPEFRPAADQAAAPAPRVMIPAGGGSLEIFPYLTDDLSSNGRDPVNLVFMGQADPRSIRAALMALDGNRGGTPLAPFDCTWKDAVGGLQAAWSGPSSWVGGVIQLECGDYGPVRFHLRLFDVGDHTLGGAHFEFLIPGTSDHQVASWELAEQLVTYDIARTGRLGAAPGSTGTINAAPSFRSIPGFLYALAVQADPAFGALLGMLGLVNLPGGDKGIPTDGAATMLTMATAAPLLTGSTSRTVEVPFGQVIPKPFCLDGAPSPYLHVAGNVRLSLRTSQQASGGFDQEMRAEGRLTLTPVDPSTGLPAGNSYQAQVSEFQQARISPQGASIQGVQHQLEIPAGVPGHGQLQIKIRVGAEGAPRFDRKVVCGGS